MIYSSNRNNQIIEIHPTLTEVRSPEVLTLAYIALKGFEHYDVCILNNENLDDMQYTKETNPCAPNKDIMREASQTTPHKTLNPDDVKIKAKKRSGSSPPGITPRKKPKYITPQKRLIMRNERND